MRRHEPGTVWPIRRFDWTAYVGTVDDDHLRIVGHVANGDLTCIRISRDDARILARRINQCLDATMRGARKHADTPLPAVPRSPADRTDQPQGETHG